jgi:serine/threonine-protein kinase NIM1
VFFTSPAVVKIGDFGFSAHAQASQLLNTFCGSPPYAAPELFKDQHYDGRCVDVWALGILLFFIVTAIMPFRADTVGKLKKLILEGVYVIPPYVPSSCAALIRGILKPLPADRLTLSNVAKSAWLAGEQLPVALPKYQLNPTVDSPVGGTGLSEDEMTARRRLNDLGINDTLLRQSSVKEARSSIIGTYRIMLHRVQREHDGYEPVGLTAADEALFQQCSTTFDANGKRRQDGGRRPKPSKLCAIL